MVREREREHHHREKDLYHPNLPPSLMKMQFVPPVSLPRRNRVSSPPVMMMRARVKGLMNKIHRTITRMGSVRFEAVRKKGWGGKCRL
ncbi:hypothetical protein CEXT_98161 [Caerostris extrusa]|uniref:Uncharacterized protein n=1 Tax=Caerostris extrusa TaxID=172846 RepID=A0AAV4W4J7_CAEEX|nr:hypothetical protein CEXT_98161 [Caerostris extrusa]